MNFEYVDSVVCSLQFLDLFCLIVLFTIQKLPLFLYPDDIFCRTCAFDAVCCSVLSLLQCVAVVSRALRVYSDSGHAHCVALCCSVLQCVAVSLDYSVLWCVALF